VRVSLLLALGCMAALSGRQFAMAQSMVGLPDYGLSLSGTPAQPTLKNTGNRKVIVYALRFEALQPDGQAVPHTAIRSALLAIRNGNANEDVSVPAHGERTFAPRPNEIPGIASNVSLDGAIFEDGQFVGPNLGASYEWVVAGLNAQRDLYNSVLANHESGKDPDAVWAPVQALAANEPLGSQSRAQWNYAKRQKLFAQELINVRELHGDEAAYDLARKVEKLPKIWR
jgi:hypothetical protein